LPRSYEADFPEPHAVCDRLCEHRDVLRAVVCAGLYPNIVYVSDKNMDLKLMEWGEEVSVHPGSICAGQVPHDWSLLVYHRKNRTTKLFIYDLTAASPTALCAFGGAAELHADSQRLAIGQRFWLNCRRFPGKFADAAHMLLAVQGMQLAMRRLVQRANERKGLHLGASSELALLLAALAPEEPQFKLGAEDERRVDPRDGRAWTLAEMLALFDGRYPGEETVEYWYKTCKSPGAVHIAVEALETSVADLPIADWLQSIAQNGALLPYRDALANRYHTVVQIIGAYVSVNGEGLVCLKPAFFEDIGVSKAGHRRLFEMWFTHGNG